MPFEEFKKEIWPVCLPLKKNKNINHLNGRVGRLGAFGRNTNKETDEGQDENIGKEIIFMYGFQRVTIIQHKMPQNCYCAPF